MKRILYLLVALLILAAPCAVSAEQSYQDLCLLRLTPYVDIVEINGLYPSVYLAQGMLETGWCRSDAVKRNNFWGIKCREAPCFSKRTWEVYNGAYWQGEALFQVFESAEDGTLSYVTKILYQYEYRNVNRANRETFVDSLAKVWATDPNYAAKIKSIIRDYGLEKYDER